MAFGETVQILHPSLPGPDDELGNPTVTEPWPEDCPGVAVAPGDTRENTNQQATTEVALTLYFTPLPALPSIEPAAKITVRGTTYEVEGEAEDWRDPFNQNERVGLVVALRRAQ